MEQSVKILAIGMHTKPESGGADRYFHELAATMGDSMESITVSHPEEPLGKRWNHISQTLGSRLDIQTPLASHFALYAFPLRKRLRNIPYVVHFHGPWAEESKMEGARPWVVFAKKQLEKRVYRTADRFIVLSNTFREILINDYGISPDLIRVIPGGIQSSKYSTILSQQEARLRLGWPEDAQIVLSVRRLTQRTGVQNLIEAWRGIAPQHPQARLMIAGKGPLEEDLRNQIRSLGLQESITMLGFVPDEELPSAYRAGDFTVVPTIDLEGFGLITLESLASGTPPLVTPVGGLPEAVQGLDKNLILEDSSVSALREGIQAALNGQLVLPTAEACQDYVRRNFDWSVITPRIQAVYEEAAALYRE